jgi:Flp pilus assembly protein TadG
MLYPHHAATGYMRGQAPAEFAMIAVPALMLIFGLMNFSLAVYDYNFVSYAAREATRYAAVRGSSSASPASATDVKNVVIALAHGLDTSKITVSTTWSPNNSPGGAVHVQVSYPFSFAIPFITLASVTFSSTSQLVITQ